MRALSLIVGAGKLVAPRVGRARRDRVTSTRRRGRADGKEDALPAQGPHSCLRAAHPVSPAVARGKGGRRTFKQPCRSVLYLLGRCFAPPPTWGGCSHTLPPLPALWKAPSGKEPTSYQPPGPSPESLSSCIWSPSSPCPQPVNPQSTLRLSQNGYRHQLPFLLDSLHS